MSTAMREKQKEDLSYEVNACQFKIETSLKQNLLAIKLFDYSDGFTYQRQYGETNGSDQIQKQFQLFDIYISLKEGQAGNQVMIEQKQEERQKNQKYTFGNVIKYKNVPCFKVQREGKVTIYKQIINQLTKKKIIYETTLILKKIEDQQRSRRKKQKILYFRSNEQQNSIERGQEFHLDSCPQRKQRFSNQEQQQRAQRAKLQKNFSHQICLYLMEILKQQEIEQQEKEQNLISISNEDLFNELKKKTKKGLKQALHKQELRQRLAKIFNDRKIKRMIMLGKGRLRQKKFNLKRIRKEKQQFISFWLELANIKIQ